MSSQCSLRDKSKALPSHLTIAEERSRDIYGMWYDGKHLLLPCCVWGQAGCMALTGDNFSMYHQTGRHCSSPVLGHGWPGLLGSRATVKKAPPLSPLASDSENRLVVSSPAEGWSQKRGRGTLSENYLSCSDQLAMLKDTRRMLGADFPSTAILPQVFLDSP